MSGHLLWWLKALFKAVEELYVIEKWWVPFLGLVHSLAHAKLPIWRKELNSETKYIGEDGCEFVVAATIFLQREAWKTICILLACGNSN